MFKALLLTAILITSISCSMVKKTAISTTASIMNDGSGEMNTEGNFPFFEKATPANLKMIEGFWYADQTSQTLLTLLIKGYGGFAFGVSETRGLQDSIDDKEDEDSHFKQQAIYHYTKAFDYGIKYFELKGIKYQDLKGVNAGNKLISLLNDKLNEVDMMAIFYFAQSWGGLINLQRTNVALLSNLASVKTLMDWVCKQDSTFEYGSCKLFYAVYEAGRPAMLGGNLSKGKKLFLELIKEYPENLLSRVSYIQYYIIPTMDEILYAKEAEYLKKELSLWRRSLNLGTRSKSNMKYVKNKHFNLFNSIANERFKTIEKNLEELF